MPPPCRPDGQRLQSSTQDVSAQGAAVRLAAGHGVAPGDTVTLTLPHRRGPPALTACVTAITPRSVRMRWVGATPQQQQALVECTFARNDAWSSWSHGRRPDRLVVSLLEVMATGVAGYRRLAGHALGDAARVFRPLRRRLRRARMRIAHVLLRPPTSFAGQSGLPATLSAPIGHAATKESHA